MGTAAVIAGERIPLAEAALPDNSHGEIKVWVTDNNRKLAQVPALAWRPAPQLPGADTVV
jgi:hypothetical protein